MSIDKSKAKESEIGGAKSSSSLSSNSAVSVPNDLRDTEHNAQHFSTDHLLRNLKGRTISGGFITVLAQGVQLALTLLSTMVLARLLPPADFGLVAMVTAVLSYFRIFMDAGLSVATLQRQDITHAQVSNLFWINAALSAAAGLLVAAAAPAIAWFYREPQLVNITLALSATFLLSGLTVQHMALLSRQMRFRSIAMIQIVSMMGGIAIGIGMAWLNCGYWSLVGMQIGAPFVSLLLTWSALRWRPQFPVRRVGTWPLVSFGANLTATSVIYSLAHGIDAPLIGRTYGADSVGLYSRAAALVVRPLDQILSPIYAVFVPVLSRLQDEPERYRRVFLQVYEAITLISILFGGLLLPLAYPLTLVVLGPNWKEAAPIFAGFAILALSAPLLNASTWLFASQGRGKDFFVATLVASLLTVFAFVAGLPFGPAGVAIAYSAISVLTVLPVVCHIAGRSGPVGAIELYKGFFRHIPVWGVVCGTTYLVHTMIADRAPWMQLLICVPIGLLVGLVFICLYSPARRTARSLLDALLVLKNTRTATPT